MKSQYKISESEILRISNDISEDMCSAKKNELIEVIKYFRDELDLQIQARVRFRDEIGVVLMKDVL